jgi:predicted transcriptional regulator
MKDVDLHVGYDPAASKARVLDAIRRAEAGAVVPESHVTFESWDGLSRALSGKRLELLRHVRQDPAASIAELARALDRDYKRVHEDVEILAAAGLLDRTETGGVRAAYDEIRTVISLTTAA